MEYLPYYPSRFFMLLMFDDAVLALDNISFCNG